MIVKYHIRGRFNMLLIEFSFSLQVKSRHIFKVNGFIQCFFFKKAAKHRLCRRRCTKLFSTLYFDSGFVRCVYLGEFRFRFGAVFKTIREDSYKILQLNIVYCTIWVK